MDWNNPDVEYLMKHFKMVAANRDDEIAALTKSNEELRNSNEELRMAYGKLEAKYECPHRNVQPAHGQGRRGRVRHPGGR